MSMKENRSNVFEHSAGFNLGLTYRKMSQLFTNRLKPYDITPEQWTVLYCIRVKDGMIQKEIAELASKDKPTTTRILDVLEAKGLIYKKAGEADRRSFLVYLTDKGRDVAAQTETIEHQAVQDATAGISEDEYEHLLELLRRIGANTDRLNERE